MEKRELEKLLLTLLEPGVYKTTSQLVQEFRMEFPRAWRELEREGRRLYGSSCGAYQQPATRIAQALFNLPQENVSAGGRAIATAGAPPRRRVNK